MIQAPRKSGWSWHAEQRPLSGGSKLIEQTLSNLSFLSGAPPAFECRRRFNGLFDRSNILIVFGPGQGGHFHITSDMDVWQIRV